MNFLLSLSVLNKITVDLVWEDQKNKLNFKFTNMPFDIKINALISLIYGLLFLIILFIRVEKYPPMVGKFYTLIHRIITNSRSISSSKVMCVALPMQCLFLDTILSSSKTCANKITQALYEEFP